MSIIQAIFERKDHECIKQLIIEGADMNQRNESGYPLLAYACAGSSAELVRLLFENGAKIENDSYKLFDSAIHFDQFDNVKVLIEYGADVFAKGNAYESSLYFVAVKQGNPRTVQILLDHGVDNSQDTATLHWMLTQERHCYKPLLIDLYRMGAPLFKGTPRFVDSLPRHFYEYVVTLEQVLILVSPFRIQRLKGQTIRMLPKELFRKLRVMLLPKEQFNRLGYGDPLLMLKA